MLLSLNKTLKLVDKLSKMGNACVMNDEVFSKNFPGLNTKSSFSWLPVTNMTLNWLKPLSRSLKINCLVTILKQKPLRKNIEAKFIPFPNVSNSFFTTSFDLNETFSSFCCNDWSHSLMISSALLKSVAQVWISFELESLSNFRRHRWVLTSSRQILLKIWLCNSIDFNFSSLSCSIDFSKFLHCSRTKAENFLASSLFFSTKLDADSFFNRAGFSLFSNSVNC